MGLLIGKLEATWVSLSPSRVSSHPPGIEIEFCGIGLDRVLGSGLGLRLGIEDVPL